MVLITRKLTVIIALYSVPALFILFFCFLFKQDVFYEFWVNPVTRYIIGIIFASILIFILTSTKPLLFLGQAERYFEYSAPFISLLFVIYGVFNNWDNIYFIYLLIFQISVVIAILLYLLRSDIINKLKTVREANDKVLMLLNQTTDHIRVLTIPSKLSYFISSYINNSNVLFYYNLICTDSGFDYMEEDSVKYNSPRPDLDWFKDRYGINALIISKNSLKSNTIGGIQYDFHKLQLIEESNQYIMYRL